MSNARYPCSVHGCQATTSRFSVWICTRHWRLCCPPRSPQRRTYLRFFRETKRLGLAGKDRWPAALERRFWRFWDGLVRRAARIEREGGLVVAEIHKMFGWDE